MVMGRMLRRLVPYQGVWAMGGCCKERGGLGGCLQS